MANFGRFEAMALALATGTSIKKASQSAGISVRHGYRVAASSKMRFRVGELRSQIANEAVGRLTQGATKAADTLVELLGEANEPSTRMNAAKAILANLGPLSELAELRSRLDRLEQASALRAVS
jgi:hypothetical protein